MNGPGMAEARSCVVDGPYNLADDHCHVGLAGVVAANVASGRGCW